MEASKKEAARKKSLGELGELFAIKALVDEEFDEIRNLNDDKMNEAFAYLLCKKDGETYIVSVKARNKFQKNGTENKRYNLGSNAYEKAAFAEKKYGATACWMAIQFDKNLFSIYFGSLLELKRGNAIPIDKCQKGEIGKIFVKNKRHYFDFDFYTNQISVPVDSPLRYHA